MCVSNTAILHSLTNHYCKGHKCWKQPFIFNDKKKIKLNLVNLAKYSILQSIDTSTHTERGNNSSEQIAIACSALNNSILINYKLY